MLPYIIIPLVGILLVAIILFVLSKGITYTVVTEIEKANVVVPETKTLLDRNKNISAKGYSFDEMLHIPKNGKKDYSSLFLVDSGEIARKGKTVNIRPEFHDRLSLLLRVYANSNITLFSYIDNILKTHLDTYQVEIDELLESSINQLLPSGKR